jgi:hypothetical protein
MPQPPRTAGVLSVDTLSLFKEMLSQLQLPVSHPDFERQAARLVQAQRELDAALGNSESA